MQPADLSAFLLYQGYPSQTRVSYHPQEETRAKIFAPCLIKPHDQLLLFSFPSVFSLVIRSMCTKTGLTNWAIGSRWFLVSLKLSKTRD